MVLLKRECRVRNWVGHWNDELIKCVDLFLVVSDSFVLKKIELLMSLSVSCSDEIVTIFVCIKRIDRIEMELGLFFLLISDESIWEFCMEEGMLM